MNVEAGSEASQRRIAAEFKLSINKGLAKYDGGASAASSESSKHEFFRLELRAWGVGLQTDTGEISISSMSELLAAVGKHARCNGGARTIGIFTPYSLLQCYQRALSPGAKLAVSIDTEFLVRLNTAFYTLLFLDKEMERKGSHIPNDLLKPLFERSDKAKDAIRKLSLDEAARAGASWSFLREPDQISQDFSKLSSEFKTLPERVYRLTIKSDSSLPVSIRIEGSNMRGGMALQIIGSNTMRMNTMRFFEGQGALVCGEFHNAIKKLVMFCKDASLCNFGRESTRSDCSKVHLQPAEENHWVLTLSDATALTPDFEIIGKGGNAAFGYGFLKNFFFLCANRKSGGRISLGRV